MTNLINYRRILLSSVVIAFVASLVFAGTQAFFSDTETSTGNTFTAGDIDLQIDNESYAIDYNIPGYDNPQGEFVANPDNSWSLTDLTVERFFDFVDLKPGDYGEDTISIHVGSNNAWVCAAAQITEDEDNSITEPEDEESGANNDNDDGTPDGDLDSELNFAFWVDDGDNILEDDEVSSLFLEGSLADMGAAGQITLADSSGSVLGGGAVPGDSTFWIGKGWCFGALTPNPVAQDNASSSDPLQSGTGFSCDGSAATNLAQTDSVVGDLEFYAVQERHNDSFLCSEWTPSFEGQQPNPPVLTLAKTVVGGATSTLDTDWTLTASGTDNGTSISGAEGDGSITSAVVEAGSYDLSESGPGGFSLTDLSCSGGSLATSTLTLADGEDVTCTFTNTAI